MQLDALDKHSLTNILIASSPEKMFKNYKALAGTAQSTKYMRLVSYDSDTNHNGSSDKPFITEVVHSLI